MKVKLSKSAKKDIKKLDKDTRERVYKEIRLFRQGFTGIARLKGHKNIGKIKIGNYRIRYEIDRENKIATITEVILRKDAYRDL